MPSIAFSSLKIPEKCLDARGEKKGKGREEGKGKKFSTTWNPESATTYWHITGHSRDESFQSITCTVRKQYCPLAEVFTPKHTVTWNSSKVTSEDGIYPEES